MSTGINLQTVKSFFAAIGAGDRETLLTLVAEDVEWIIPGEDWPLAGTHRGQAGLAELLEKASTEIETEYPTTPEFLAQGGRVFIVGVAAGRIKASNRSFRDNWVFDVTVRHGKIVRIREYVDTQALALAAAPMAPDRTNPTSDDRSDPRAS